MSKKGHAVYTQNRKTVLHKSRRKQKMLTAIKSQKIVSNKLMKGLLDLIILQFLNNQPMHGYQIITKIRKNYGVYFGPCTIYPLLNTLEKKSFVKSEWNMNFDRPRKMYSLTNNGKSMLSFTKESLNLICRKITAQANTETAFEPSTQPVIGIIAKRSRNTSTSHLALFH